MKKHPAQSAREILTVLASSPSMERGHPLPLGGTAGRDGINFAVFSRHATAVTLVVYLPGASEAILEIPLDPRFNRTGDVWHLFLRGLAPEIEYGWKMNGPPEGPVHRFAPSRILLDPYSRAISGAERWGLRPSTSGAALMRARRSRVVDDAFDWGTDQPLNRHLADSIVYELHVRGFTRHESSRVEHPGTFLGVVEKIPYLKELGVTAVELMPVTEFEELDNTRVNPVTGEGLLNFWGYHPIGFFAPKASFASGDTAASAPREFKEMVKALHAAGIEVILDMVYNHTAEGDERGPTLSFRGLDNAIYYLLDPQTGSYLNYSGCGNTLNCNHPVVRDLILASLRYWVTEMHVDGFRFDLASILGRGRDGSVLPNPPLLERIAADPVLANTKLIAEAWDAAGLYQVGTFPNWGRWAEWNGKFRDDVRRFVRGDAGSAPVLATRLAGSADLYQHSGRAPFHSINFVTSHDGFTLADLVSYRERHNEANGEDNQDGQAENFSWDCGVEGATTSSAVLSLRRRQVRNFATILLLSQGVPMILAGDEMGRTQLGNNNAYCHDGPLSWINWGDLEENPGLFRFFRILIAYRRSHPVLRRRTFFQDRPEADREIVWHGPSLDQPDWTEESRALAMHLIGGNDDDDLYVIAHAHPEPRAYELPSPFPGKRWRLFVDTSRDTPEDIREEDHLRPVRDPHRIRVSPWSVVVLVGR